VAGISSLKKSKFLSLLVLLVSFCCVAYTVYVVIIDVNIDLDHITIINNTNHSLTIFKGNVADSLLDRYVLDYQRNYHTSLKEVGSGDFATEFLKDRIVYESSKEQPQFLPVFCVAKNNMKIYFNLIYPLYKGNRPLVASQYDLSYNALCKNNLILLFPSTSFFA
jgi:hypothetical protein